MRARGIRFFAVPAVLSASVLLAGCGGKEESATTKWAGGVCSAIGTWKDSVGEAASSLTAGTPTKATLTSAADDVRSATQTLSDDLKQLGKPGTEAGQTASSTVNTLSTQLSTGMNEIQSATAGVSTVSGLLDAFTSVSGTLATMGKQITTAVDTLASAEPASELGQAFSDADSCDELKAG